MLLIDGHLELYNQVLHNMNPQKDIWYLHQAIISSAVAALGTK